MPKGNSRTQNQYIHTKSSQIAIVVVVGRKENNRVEKEGIHTEATQAHGTTPERRSHISIEKQHRYSKASQVAFVVVVGRKENNCIQKRADLHQSNPCTRHGNKHAKGRQQNIEASQRYKSKPDSIGCYCRCKEKKMYTQK